MAKVNATCKKCGDKEMTNSDVTVWVCRDDHSGAFRFTCPQCGTYRSQEASRRTLDLLVAIGCEVIFWGIPVERIVDRQGTLTHNCLIDFHHFLQDDHHVDRAIYQLVNS